MPASVPPLALLIRWKRLFACAPINLYQRWKIYVARRATAAFTLLACSPSLTQAACKRLHVVAQPFLLTGYAPENRREEDTPERVAITRRLHYQTALKTTTPTDNAE
jgi:hypothetical protein